MNILDPVSKIMTTDLITLAPDSKISDAAKIFETRKVHQIPIVVGDQLVGILSKSDYLYFRRGFLDSAKEMQKEEARMNEYQVDHLMTKGIAKLESDSRINVALELFKENIFHAIPVIEDDKLVGIVTTYDIIKNLADDRSAEAKY